MKNHFLISDSEKSRILNLHESRKPYHGTSLLNEEEDKSVMESLARKINGIIKSRLRIEDLVSNQKLIFGFRRVDGRFTMISPTAAKDFKGMGPFDGDNLRGKFQLNGNMLFLKTPSAGYVDIVETNLNDEEKLNFDKEGFIPSFPNKSLKNLIKDGTINIILKGGGQSFMSYEKAYNQSQLNQFCGSLTKFNNLGDEVPVEDILLTDTASGKKKICYGQYRVSQSNISLSIPNNPLTGILNSNRSN